MTASITMRPSSSVFVDLFTPDGSFTCRALRVLPPSNISSRNRKLPDVYPPVPVSGSKMRRIQTSPGAAGSAEMPGEEPGMSAPPHFGYSYYYDNYHQPRVPVPAYGSPDSANAERSAPAVPAAPAEQRYDAPAFAPSTEAESPSQALVPPQPPAPEPFDAASPSQLFSDMQLLTALGRNPTDPGSWQSPPPGHPPLQPHPPQSPYPPPPAASPVNPGGTVRHPITLPVGTTVTAPVTIPITLPITSPSLSPLTIAFPVNVPGVPDYFPNPSRPREPAPEQPAPPSPYPTPLPTSPAPTPPPYYPYPPYYPPRPRPIPPGGYPGYPPTYPYPLPSQPYPPPPPQTPNPAPVPPIPPRRPAPQPQPGYPRNPYPAPPTSPYPYPGYPPYYPYPPPQTPYPSPYPSNPTPVPLPPPAPTPPGEENPPLPSPVPERPYPPPRRPGRGGGGSESHEYYQALPQTLSDPGAPELGRDAEAPRGHSAAQKSPNSPSVERQTAPLAGGPLEAFGPPPTRPAAAGGRPEKEPENSVSVDAPVNPRVSSVARSSQTEARSERPEADFLRKKPPASPQAAPAVDASVATQTTNSVVDPQAGSPADTSGEVNAEARPSATITKEGISFSPSVFDQFMAAIVAQMERRDRSEPLFLPSICPACKVDIVTYAPIQMPELETEDFGRARDQLNHLQRYRVPQGTHFAGTRQGEVQEMEEATRAQQPAADAVADAEGSIEVENAGDDDVAAAATPIAPMPVAARRQSHPEEGEDDPEADAAKRKAAVVNLEAAAEKDEISAIFAPVNRRKRPKEFRSLAKEFDAKGESSASGESRDRTQDAIVVGEVPVSASHPVKRDSVAVATEYVSPPPSVYRSRLDAGEEEGTFAVMFACYHPENDAEEPEALLMANIEVRVANEMPIPVSS
ncbi:hypothetical protein BESB_002530 [Besnoitia besnoiti]|uniref:Uncharacterized protein n=1 Tax=Besnoitia besnoiti TaxID=94643 RepID=A0A2A9MPW5_BESBE|nr:hypothetical protein BESB_002530 [Besnoitia besnoiti]PFH37912.1 hypothetical protein BESB_002530 [Besnoitia besnoiti]